MSDQALGEHALLSDCHTAALVDRNGSVEWWPTPQFDDPSVFARLLDPKGGHFSITGRNVQGIERKYVEGTLVLESIVTTATGIYRLTECLAMGPGIRGHQLGKDSPHVLLRNFECIDGEVVLDVELAPAFEYGLSRPIIEVSPGSVQAIGGAIGLLLTTPQHLEAVGAKAIGAVALESGQQAGFALETYSNWADVPSPWAAADIKTRLDDTVASWRSWGEAHQSYEGPYQELVSHSGRVLQALTYWPTGAMVAAPTTSLPETVGGSRNWDYRFSWIRDASHTLRAMWVAACPDEAAGYLDYLTTSAGALHGEDDMQIMFGIRGERDLTEREVPWLRGWRESNPVRVGNGAWNQSQLDVYGELLSAVYRLRDQFDEIDDSTKTFLCFLGDRAAEVWDTKDHGIWEVRDELRHYVHSKLMCWVALDRAIEMATMLGASEERITAWKAAREEIRRVILERGWSEEAGSFVQAFDSTALDASSLMIPLVRFLPFDDERIKATIEAIRARLTDDRGMVYRYRSQDGLEGDEGTFLLCTFWLVQALAGSGDLVAARDLFDVAIGHRNDVDLLSEEIDASSGEMIGNFPQAFSHVGLINAAWAIARAERGEKPESRRVGD